MNVDAKRANEAKQGSKELKSFDMDLAFEKYCKVDESPRTVLPSPQHSERHEKSNRNSKSSSRNSRLSLEAGFKEIKFRNYQRSVSCRTLPTKNPELAVDKEVLKRGSVYQSSKERKSLNRPDSVGGRKKIEFSLSGDTPFSFSLLDSICGSDAEEEEKPRESCSSRPAERDLLENSKFKSQEVVGPSSNGNILKEEDNQTLQKSLSAKLALPHSPTRLDSKSQFTPLRKMLDPLTKSKSHHGSLSSKLESSVIRSSDASSNGRKKTLRKSLLNDFSTTMPQCSPAHLHGDLKLEHNHGAAYFVFSLAHSENVLMAESHKTEDALNWIYTFHSVSSREKSNKDSPIVGKMQASCHLCSELKDGGAFSNSMRTEFVLYDTSRKSVADEEVGCDDFEPHASKEGLDEMFDPIKLKTQAANDSEIGAVVIQVPFNKKSSGNTRVNVVLPLGNHSLPSCDSRGPSPLLDRWRLGGGCDCSGWDMACPLVVLDNMSPRRKGKERNPFDLHVKGAKERNPALTIKCVRKGQYSVDFHAQLSALQALAICVAILETTEGSTMADCEKHRQLLQSSSLKVLVEDELKVLVEAITEEDKGKGKEKAVRATEEHPSSFMLNPPFSPIARV